MGLFGTMGFKENGLGYLKHFMGPMLALAPLMFLIEMIGNFARALSLSMRLFGNIYGEHSATGVFTSMVPIAQAMVAGDKRPYLVGLIVPDAEWALAWARAEGKNFNMTALQDLPAFRTAIRAAIDRVNQEVSVIEKVRQFAFADEAFGIDNEEMTPSLKIRRHKLKERYGARLDALYKS